METVLVGRIDKATLEKMTNKALVSCLSGSDQLHREEGLGRKSLMSKDLNHVDLNPDLGLQRMFNDTGAKHIVMSEAIVQIAKAKNVVHVVIEGKKMLLQLDIWIQLIQYMFTQGQLFDAFHINVTTTLNLGDDQKWRFSMQSDSSYMVKHNTSQDK